MPSTDIRTWNEGACLTHNKAQQMADALIGLADVTAVFSSNKEILLKGQPVTKLTGMRNVIESRLSGLGYKPEVITTEPSLVVRMSSLEAPSARKIPWLNLILFFATCVTTILCGAWQDGLAIFSNPGMIIRDPLRIIVAGLPFSTSILAILLFHEFGHYFAGRKHGVNVTLPYFIPAPNIIGTFGAFIRSKSPFINRRQLLDVAAAGPLAGIIIAIIVLAIGTAQSPIVPLPEIGEYMYLGDSLLQQFIIYAVRGPIPEGQTIMMNSISFAGWVGLLVTMFNLLPIGQLDGGHIMYAMFGKTQKTIAYAAMFGLLALSMWWTGWVFWLLLSFLMKPAHPPTLLDEEPIGRKRQFVGLLSIAVFILCFMPIPVSFR